MAPTTWKRVGRALIVPALALITALLIGAVVMVIFGDNPLQAYAGLFAGAFEWGRPISTTIRKMTPLILTGLSVAVAFKAGLFNIGASGQFIMGTVASVAVGTAAGRSGFAAVAGLLPATTE